MNSRPTADHAAVRGESGQRQGVPGRHTPSPAHTPYTVTDSEGDANTNTRDTGDCPQTVMKFFFQCVYLSVFYSWCQWRQCGAQGPDPSPVSTLNSSSWCACVSASARQSRAQ